MPDATELAVKQMANREVFNNTFRLYKTGELFDYIDYANTGNVTYKTTTVYARGGHGGGRRMAFEGQPEATMKLSTQIITPKLISMLSGTEVIKGANVFKHRVIASHTAETTTTITFPDGEIPLDSTLFVYPVGSDLNSENKIAGTLNENVFNFTEPATEDGDYDCFYETTIAEAQSVTFKGNVFPSDFIWDGETLWKDDDGSIRTEVFHAYRVHPQQNFTMNYQNTGDPGSLEITFDLLENKQKQIFTKTFLPDDSEA